MTRGTSGRPPRPISIWQPRSGKRPGDTVWVRPEPGPFGDHYATRRELRPKASELPLRVALFGESVAAGYLYAPHLTPAGVLQAQLRAVGGDGNFEVIDLARTNETLAGLLATLRASLQINPDVLVLFAGNNWNLLETPEVSPYAPAFPARREFAAALRQEGLGGPARLASKRLRKAAESAFAEIALIARTVGVPVVVVVPEVDLADWENRQPVAWLPGDGVACWYRHLRDAVGALEEGRWEAAEVAAQAMLALDGGSCPTAWRIVAKARQAAGDTSGAVAAARAEIDAARYPTLAFLAAPQCGPEIQGLLRELARRHGFACVDLPQVFSDSLSSEAGSPLPDRRLFLDYCHLTAAGMRVAMAAVAAAVLDLSGMLDRPPDWRSLAAGGHAPRIAPEAEATARLGAAIHTAHRLLCVSGGGAKRPLLERWCTAALAAAPGVAAAFLDVVAARSAPCPAVLSAAQQRNAVSPFRLLLQHGWAWDHLDADVIAAIRSVLAREDASFAAEIDSRLLAFRGVSAQGVDLAAPPFFYLWEPLERFYPEVMSLADVTAPALLRCPWPEVSFCLLWSGDGEVDLEATVRLPPPPGKTDRCGRVGLSLNGRFLGALDAAERWSRARFPAPRQALRRGLNRLTLHWPDPPPAGDAPLSAVADRLERGLPADLHPVFGEVFSLRARALGEGV